MSPPPMSLLSRRFNIPSIADNIARWDQVWKETLGRLTTPEDIFLILKETWDLDERGSSSALVLSDVTTRIRGQVLQSQELAAKLVCELDSRKFGSVRAVMEEEELKRHYFHGVKEACARASLREDRRALCPEITRQSDVGEDGIQVVHRSLSRGGGVGWDWEFGGAPYCRL